MGESSDTQSPMLIHVWRVLVTIEPGLGVSAALFGTHPREWPDALKFVTAPMQVRDNPPIAPNTTALHGWIVRTADRLRPTPVFAAWPYLIVGLFALPFAWRRRRDLAAGLALVILVSGTLYAAPLIVAAPSAELRYLLWPCIASLVAGVLACAGQRNGARGWPL